ncbi:dioxygenase family protein [Pedobacter duraquae]|uniref:Catalytic LigB subunit of aromatic ring-opening dioxygenase n=1 Tax=Pedobacter duraquae TaxID=425511 RepID=A0A4R6IR42_9SPHI|nr:class III extradiol ring-cleavage dioxygenase [Pedobacter duraquae]TDO24697.1 catalytic LigB subunit of aromatic ring-opening dioxygenase [Pedobacter duraquae]
MQLQQLHKKTQNYPVRVKKMPVLFVGHGHPLNAVSDNPYTQALALQGQSLETPAAILVISAHWETIGTAVSINPLPRTIHDFGPFDKRLFQINYPAPGHPDLARELKELVNHTNIIEDHTIGLDHGAWTVLLE